MVTACAGAGLLERPIGGGDLAHLAGLARGQRQHGIAHRDLAAGDGAGVAAEIGVRAIHELDRETQLLQAVAARHLDAFERLEQRAAGVPRRFLGAARHDVHAVQRAHRNHLDVGHAQLVGVGDELGGDAVELRAVVVDAVHLVDREDDVLHAEQRDDVRVAARLHAHALLGVHQHHGGFGGGSAGGHVARVLLVARAVGHDELALRRLRSSDTPRRW